MLELQHLKKTFAQKTAVVESISNLSLSVGDSEFVALVGPSGCGKTTLLKIIAGLLEPTGGQIILDGQPVNKPDKDKGLVFQNFSLFPWLTVRENIAFGLRLQKISALKQEKIINHYLEITGLQDFAKAYPKNLSGGMQQRVAIARTLANSPKILLMDEPFGSLDAQTRSQMQEFLTSLWDTERPTILFVTHDVGEAIFLADKVCVLTKRPMQIKETFNIPFDRPRLHNLKRAKEFFDLELKISEKLEN